MIINSSNVGMESARTYRSSTTRKLSLSTKIVSYAFSDEALGNQATLGKNSEEALETEGQGTGRLLAYRDSFGNLLYPYLADSSASARFSRSTMYDLTLEADRVLVELVERNLKYLVTYGAIMPAIEADLTLPETVEGTLAVTTGKRSGLVQVQGKLPETADAIWVVADGKAREAFMLSDCGYMVSVPEDAKWSHVVYTAGEEMIMYEITLEEN